ncbi:MAG: xanthine dehydrogenase family protein molybdopterin-binding subunit, partial [Candidatus Eremiobacteraeota bacterium]|nr:xanthine dehydrogenase family protein molybdopterin-binding subunit [Candidatus Eremiobacteraeota bacterium]
METLARSSFVKIVLGTGAGLAIGAFARERALASPETAGANPLGTWVRIEPDDRIVITINKSEMGQGVATGLPTILADELDAPLDRVVVDFAPAEPQYLDPVSKGMSTGGSTSVKNMWLPLRTAGATARAMLVAAAAKSWNVEAKECTTRAGTVYHAASHRSAKYGALAAAAAALSVPENVPLKTPQQWNLIGKHNRRLDIATKVNGKARYGMDVKVPGMAYASIKRSPVFGGKVRSFDASRAKNVRGVREVVETSRGVAVIADNTWAAFTGQAALDVVWDEGPNANLGTAELFAEAEKLASAPGIVAKNVGDVAAAGGTKLEATYKGPYLAHAAMEPMNCTARVTNDSCEVWAPTQNQTAALAAAQAVTGFEPRQIA